MSEIAGVAAAGGPILGGVLVSAANWRLVFFVNVPIGLVAMVLIARHVPAPRAHPHSLDPAAQLTGVLALAALTLALRSGDRDRHPRLSKNDLVAYRKDLARISNGSW